MDATRPEAGTPVVGEPPAGDDEQPAEVPPLWTYWDQPDAFRDKERDDTDHLPDGDFLVYLKVTERLVTFLQDPEVRETALGTALPDTTARVKVTWQVLPLKLEPRDDPRQRLDKLVTDETSTARLAARTDRPAKAENDPCLAAPDSRYRGPENQLYRVEVHRGGKLSAKPTFKWSRENGSVAFGISSIAENIVTLTNAGRDGKLDLDVGDWVEIVDDAYTARGVPAKLLRVTDIDTERLRVELSGGRDPSVGGLAARHPFLRRWDHQSTKLDDGALALSEDGWLDLEDGVQVWFAKDGVYQPGDYWLIAARTLTGDVEWPHDVRGRPLLRAPHGIRHHYAPLARVHGDGVDDLRMVFRPLAVPVTGN